VLLKVVPCDAEGLKCESAKFELVRFPETANEVEREAETETAERLEPVPKLGARLFIAIVGAALLAESPK
jgi:hypothetical protein